MIGQVRKARLGCLDPKADGWAGMNDEVRGQSCSADCPTLPRNVTEPHSSGKIAKVDRKERRGEGAPDAFLEAQHRRGRSPDVQRHPLVEERPEEAKPLEVIEVQVREEHVELASTALEELDAELSDPGAGVEHEDGPVGQRDLDARGVAAEFDRLRARCRHRAAAAPDRYPHRELTCRARRSRRCRRTRLHGRTAGKRSRRLRARRRLGS